jgi:hypothetical protein
VKWLVVYRHVHLYFLIKLTKFDKAVMHPPCGMYMINHFCRLLYDAFSIADYTAANNRIVYELEKILECICYGLIDVSSCILMEEFR